jgi:hypothetical protein
MYPTTRWWVTESDGVPNQNGPTGCNTTQYVVNLVATTMNESEARAKKTTTTTTTKEIVVKIATTEPIKIDLLCLLLNLTINKKKV